MTFDPKLSQSFCQIRDMYDSGFDSPTIGTFNKLSNSIYEIKSTNMLPDNMYNSLNDMQSSFLNQLDGLEKKIW